MPGKLFLVTILFAFSLFPKDSIDKLWQKTIDHIALGQNKKAKENIYKILTIEPSFFPEDDESPKIKSVFNATKNLFFKKFPKENQGILRQFFGPRGEIIFHLNILDHKKSITAVKLLYRNPSDPYYLSQDMKLDLENHNLYILKLKTSEKNILEYYVEIIGKYKKGFLYIGSPLSPKKINFMENKLSLNLFHKDKKDFKIIQKWPLLLGAGLVIFTVIAFGFMKIQI